MGVGHWGLVRLRGWRKKGAGSQPWTDLRMERKKVREEREGENNEVERGKGKEKKEKRRAWERDKERQRWVVDGGRDREL